MTPVQQFSFWREEISLEIEEIAQQLEAERARLVAAEVAYKVAKEADAALQLFAKDALKDLSDSALAVPLYSRLVTAREILKAPQGERGSARASVKSLEERIAQLRDAVGQIDVALTADKVTELRPNAAPARRKPQSIEFDNIAKRETV
jgi:hypothetical protein